MDSRIDWKPLLNYGLPFLYLLLTGCISNTLYSQEALEQLVLPTTISLNGEWDFTPNQTKCSTQKGQINQKITVPSNWNSKGYDIESAVYRRFFSLVDATEQDFYSLEFKGIDYISEIFINGQSIALHEGYFQNFNIDITPYVNFEKPNELVVIVKSELESSENFSLNKTQIKGVLSHHDTRPGGAWSDRAQERNSGGIWGDVNLHTSKYVKLINSPVITKKVSSRRWRVSSQLNHLGSIPDGSYVDITLSNLKDNTDLIHFTRSIRRANKLVKFNIDSPNLWWPRGMGQQNQYLLRIRIVNKGIILDQNSQKISFREVYQDKDKAWHINGKKIFLKGTNYIATPWLATMSVSDYRKDIILMEQANINVVRVHAHITGPDFYELSDQRGMMIWQDFPLQWGYTDSPEFRDEAQSQLKDMYNQLYNHPSIIQWSLHNEPPWDSPWMKHKYSSYQKNQNLKLDMALHEIAIKLDKSRPSKMLSSGIEHPWYGWYSGSWLDYKKTSKSATVSEFGAQALPGKETLMQIVGKNALWPKSDKDWQLWQYHNFQPRETFEIAKVNKGKNIDEFIKNTQAYQHDLIKLAIESYRRQAFNPVSAIFQFMFVENWPSINWGVVDHRRIPKLAYKALKTAYQDILPSAEWEKKTYSIGENIKLDLWVHNDSPSALNNISYYAKLSKSERTLHEQSWDLNIDSDKRFKIATLSMRDGMTAGSYRLSLRIESANGNVLGSNYHDFIIKE